MRISKKTKDVMKVYDKYVMPTYLRTPVVFAKAKGSYIWDVEGKKYLDFFPGWGVSGVGHCHPTLVKALQKQVKTLMHITNNYYNEYQGELAKKISRASFDGKCFFSNSGAEAIEGAIKLARRYGMEKGRYKIIAMKNSFHGRTMGAVAATGQPKYHKGFRPLVPGFIHVPFNDIKAMTKAVDNKVCAILLEVVQGEGGVHVVEKNFLKKVQALCRRKGLLLILDEVQTGIGRTGKMFAYQHFGITPDVMTLAKALGGGAVIGAMIVRRKYADYLQPGTHATTYGGNPVAALAGLSVFEILKKEKLIQNAHVMGRLLKKELLKLKKDFSFVHRVRGLGLMQGIEISEDGARLIKSCLHEGLLLNIAAGGRVIRFMPAMNITKSQITFAMKIVRKVFHKVEK